METLKAYSLPPGFGFHPTDVELVSHYLRKKLLGLKIEFEVIPEVDIYKHEPWELPAKCNIPTEDTKWHFFSGRDRKYPNGSRSKRATEAGYWKSTGKDRNIKSHKCVVGTKKTLVFHMGRPPHGKRTDWIMHEYYMDENECKASPDMKNTFVLCRVTKRNVFSPEGGMSTQIDRTDNWQKQRKDVDAAMVKKESSSPSENIDDFEDWVRELYDPNFCAVPNIGEIMSEPKEPVNSSFLTNVSDDQPPILSEDSINSVLQSEPYDFSSNVVGEFNVKTIDAASHYETSADMELNDFLASILATEHVESHMDESNMKEKPVVIDPRHAETGIQIRERRGKPHSELQGHRIRLQVRQLSSASVRTLDIVNRDCKVRLGYHASPNCETWSKLSKMSDASESVGTKVEGKLVFEESSSGSNLSQPNQEIIESLESEDNASEVSQISTSDSFTLRKRRQAVCSNSDKSANTCHDDTGCVQLAIRGIRGVCLFLRGCSSVGLNCLFLMGTAALILYFLMRDVRRFLSCFSSFPL